MRIVIAGGSGFIGAALVNALRRADHQVQVLSRQPAAARAELGPDVDVLRWDPPTLSQPWLDALAAADGVVNLAGASLANGRWTPERKSVLRSSRIGSTSALVDGLRQVGGQGKTLVSGSAVGYYGDRGEEVLTEGSGAGSDFLARLCADWEATACQAEALGTRVVLLRTGIVLGPGGALPLLVLPFRFFAGGPLGSGRQWQSWIHRNDEVELIRYALETGSVTGPLNATAPNPVRERDLAAAIGRELRRPSWAPVPLVALSLALGEMAHAMLFVSQRVLPAAAERHGFTFHYPHLEGALREALPRL